MAACTTPVVYRAELEAGLGDAVRATRPLAWASAAAVCDRFPLTDRARSLLTSSAPDVPARARAGLEDFDLHYLRDVMVSTGWNKNDDVFDRLEVWVARASPEHKPFNYQHDCADIIGHIVGNQAVGEDDKALAEDLAADDLPARFHIVSSSVLYRCWEKPDLQERMDKLLPQIARGEWFVSMECLFKGFDYAVLAPDGTARVVARDEKTAFLTKHLRAYGGSGTYGDSRVGRLLRNIVFSGKGLVKKPANPESVILPGTKAFAPAAGAGAPADAGFSRSAAAGVYLPVSEPRAEHDQESEPAMPQENENLQKQVADLTAENTRLRAEAREGDVKALKARADEAQADKLRGDELLRSAKAELEKAFAAAAAQKAELDEALAAAVELGKDLAEAREELKGIHDQNRRAARLEKVKSTLKVKAGDAEALKRAEAFALNLADLADAAFDAVLAGVDMMTLPPATNSPQDGNTTFPDQAKPRTPPSATGKPTGAAAEVESDEAGEAAAAAADLAAGRASGAALSATVQDAGVNAVAGDIAKYLGAEVEAEA